MNDMDQQLEQLIENLNSAYKMKGSVSTNTLFDALEKYDLTPSQIEQIYKRLPELGIQIFDETEPG